MCCLFFSCLLCCLSAVSFCLCLGLSPSSPVSCVILLSPFVLSLYRSVFFALQVSPFVSVSLTLNCLLLSSFVFFCFILALFLLLLLLFVLSPFVFSFIEASPFVFVLSPLVSFAIQLSPFVFFALQLSPFVSFCLLCLSAGTAAAPTVALTYLTVSLSLSLVSVSFICLSYLSPLSVSLICLFYLSLSLFNYPIVFLHLGLHALGCMRSFLTQILCTPTSSQNQEKPEATLKLEQQQQ